MKAGDSSLEGMLQRRVNPRSRCGPAKIGKVITIASGKGGVGKTLTTVNIAVALRRMGHTVLILDGDLGMSNVDVILGLQARYNILDVIEGRVSIKDIIIDGPLGVRVIPSGSGIAQLTELSYIQRVQLVESIAELEENFDFLLIDTGAGISSSVLHLNAMGDKIIVVTTPEPHAMTDAYAFIKVMHEYYATKQVSLLVNMVKAQSEGVAVGKRIADVARQFLQVEVELIGSVPQDKQVQKATMSRQAASESTTFTVAGQAWNEIARSISAASTEDMMHESRDFWSNLVGSLPQNERLKLVDMR